MELSKMIIRPFVFARNVDGAKIDFPLPGFRAIAHVGSPRVRSQKKDPFPSYRLVLAVAIMNNGMTTKATTNPEAK